MSLVEDRKRYYSSFTKKLFIYLHNFLFWIMRQLPSWVRYPKEINTLFSNQHRHFTLWVDKRVPYRLILTLFPYRAKEDQTNIIYVGDLWYAHWAENWKKMCNKKYFLRSLLLYFIFFALFFFSIFSPFFVLL